MSAPALTTSDVLAATRTLCVLTHVRRAVYWQQLNTASDDLAAGEAFAAALWELDEAIIAEVRDLQERELLLPPLFPETETIPP